MKGSVAESFHLPDKARCRTQGGTAELEPLRRETCAPGEAEPQVTSQVPADLGQSCPPPQRAKPPCQGLPRRRAAGCPGLPPGQRLSPWCCPNPATPRLPPVPAPPRSQHGRRCGPDPRAGQRDGQKSRGESRGSRLPQRSRLPRSPARLRRGLLPAAPGAAALRQSAAPARRFRGARAAPRRGSRSSRSRCGAAEQREGGAGALGPARAPCCSRCAAAPRCPGRRCWGQKYRETSRCRPAPGRAENCPAPVLRVGACGGTGRATVPGAPPPAASGPLKARGGCAGRFMNGAT